MNLLQKAKVIGIIFVLVISTQVVCLDDEPEKSSNIMNGVVTSFAEQNVTIESLSASVTQSTLMSAVGSESALKETQKEASKNVVCYYTNWSQYRPNQGRFFPEDTDPFLCTHIIYAFAKMTNYQLAAFEWNDEDTDWSVGMYHRVMNLKKINPTLKVLLAVGGWNMGSTEFSFMVQSDSLRSAFVTTTVQFLKKHKFDGLDLDWEYPANRDGSRLQDKQLFTKLIIELKTAFSADGLMLTAAVGAGKETIDTAYEVTEIAKHLDLLNLMTYDLHGAWEKFTGHHSALNGRSDETDALQKTLNVDFAVNYWINNGFPREKINMGMATYGRAFTLASSSESDLGSSATGAGTAGTYTREAGFLSYYEICEKIQQGWTRVWNDEQEIPYAHNGNQWVGYEDVQSLKIKAAYIKKMGLGGAMFWSIDLDDFGGQFCNQGKYPLLNAVVKSLKSSAQTTDELSLTTPEIPKPIPELIKVTEKPVESSTTQPVACQTDVSVSASTTSRVVCYYTNWSQYRPNKGRFLPENVDPFLCTHIIYSFAKLTNYELAAFEWNDEDTEWSVGMYRRATDLKKKNPALKLLIAIGGWNMGSTEFSQLVSDDNIRKNFVSTSVTFLKKHNFDGLDLDWEYPANRDGSKPSDRKLFSTLVSDLRTAFDPHGLILTAAVAAGEDTIKTAYEIPEIAKNLDFINLMTYDLRGAWEPVIGHHTALFERAKETEKQKTFNVNYAVNCWLDGGMPKEKINLGMATYGRSFQLRNTAETDIGSPANGAGVAGTFTRETGFVSYYEICEKLKQGWVRVWNDEQKVPYIYKDDQWVGYDDAQSLALKTKFMKEKQLGGVMFWALDLDDFSGQFCDQEEYPLLKAVIKSLSSPAKSALHETPSLTTKTEKTPRPTISALPAPKAKKPKPQQQSKPVKDDSNTDSSVDKKRSVCYYTNWSQYRPGQGRFYPENVDPSICTHIIYAFAKMTNYKLAAFEWNDEDTDWSIGMYHRAMDLKKKNPKLKIMLAVGGWNMGSPEFSTMVKSDKLRSEFVETAVAFLKKNKFDGLDLDWEYPANREGSRPEDKQLFTQLVIELKDAFKEKGFLLSAAVGAGKGTIDTAYEVPEIAKYLDFLNLMTYDLHGAWEKFTGHHSALYGRSDETDALQKTLNVDFAVNYWINNGFPREKINMGMATYGRAFTLDSSGDNDLGSTATGAGTAGTYTREAGFLSYYEICAKLKQGWTRVWNDEQKVPYAYLGNQWVGYEDVESLKIKADYINSMNLGGAMFWALDLDDFDGKFCDQEKYPLINAVQERLGNNFRRDKPINFITASSSSSVTPPSTRHRESSSQSPPPSLTSRSSTVTTPSKSNDMKKAETITDNKYLCKQGDGHYPDPTTCNKYYVCVFTNTIYQAVYHFACPDTTLFDRNLKVCNTKSLVQC